MSIKSTARMTLTPYMQELLGYFDDLGHTDITVVGRYVVVHYGEHTSDGEYREHGWLLRDERPGVVIQYLSPDETAFSTDENPALLFNNIMQAME